MFSPLANGIDNIQPLGIIALSKRAVIFGKGSFKKNRTAKAAPGDLGLDEDMSKSVI
jgi:hypothetical protein